MPPKRKASSSSSSSSSSLSSSLQKDHEDLICSICHFLLNEAVQTDCCGGLFCKKCISKWLDDSEDGHCPICRNDPEPLHQDKRTDRKASEIKRPCCNFEEGCEFSGDRESTKKHEESCLFIPREKLYQQIKKLTNDLEISEEKISSLTHQNSILSTDIANKSLKLKHVVYEDSSDIIKEMYKLDLVKVHSYSGTLFPDIKIEFVIGAITYFFRIRKINDEIAISLNRPSKDEPTISATLIIIQPNQNFPSALDRNNFFQHVVLKTNWDSPEKKNWEGIETQNVMSKVQFRNYYKNCKIVFGVKDMKAT